MLFARDAEFDPLPSEALEEVAERTGASVVHRGRAIAALSRRARKDRTVVEDLLRWATEPEFMQRRWTGFVTLAWVAVLGVGFSQPDEGTRRRLRAVLDRWDPEEVDDMRAWAKDEPWLRGT